MIRAFVIVGMLFSYFISDSVSSKEDITSFDKQSGETNEIVSQKNMTSFSDEFLAELKQKAEDYSCYGKRNAKIAIDAGKMIVAGDFVSKSEIDELETKVRKADEVNECSVRSVTNGFYCIYEDTLNYAQFVKSIYWQDGDLLMKRLWGKIFEVVAEEYSK